MSALEKQIKDQITKVNEIIITCPCCGEEIISPRGELSKLIKMNAEKIQKCRDEIIEINEKYKSHTLSEQERIELGKKKCTVCQEFEMLNKVSSEYKRKRQVLAEHESVSAYQTLKQVIVEKYGDKAYIDCMNEVMKRLQQQADNSGKRIISIL